MTWVDVRCQHCDKLLCKVTTDLRGLVQVKCQNRNCRLINTVSLAIILKQQPEKPAIIPFPTRTSAQ